MVQDLENSFPKPGAVLGWRLPKEWFQFKKDLYEIYGVKLGISYQMNYQQASDSLTDTDSAWGQFGLFEGKWELLNRERDYMGSLVWSFDWRSTIGDNASMSIYASQSHIKVFLLYPAQLWFVCLLLVTTMPLVAQPAEDDRSQKIEQLSQRL